MQQYTYLKITRTALKAIQMEMMTIDYFQMNYNVQRTRQRQRWVNYYTRNFSLKMSNFPWLLMLVTCVLNCASVYMHLKCFFFFFSFSFFKKGGPVQTSGSYHNIHQCDLLINSWKWMENMCPNRWHQIYIPNDHSIYKHGQRTTNRTETAWADGAVKLSALLLMDKINWNDKS